MIMRLFSKTPMNNLSACAGVLIAAIILPLGAHAKTEANSGVITTKHKAPIAGPLLPSPVAAPGEPVVSLALKPKKAQQSDLAFGAFQRGYYLTAFQLALPRAETGDPAAQTLIGELYWNGLGVAKDQQKAAEWFRFAADGGGREALFSIANILLRGKIIPEDKELGEKFMRKAAEAGHARAQFNLAQIITARRPTWASYKKALPYYTSAAEAGIADAQYALANIYAEAKGVQFNDDEKARIWLKKAARNGFDTAQVELGIWLANGRGGEVDRDEARKWFIKAAAQGNVIAQNRLARIYGFGVGVEKDIIKAGAWYILARRAGFTDSNMDRFFQSLSEIDKKRAIEAANQLGRRTLIR